MTKFFDKLFFGAAVIFSSASLSAQHVDQFIQVSFTPHGTSQSEVTKYTGEEAENFDVASFINTHLEKGEIQISGRISSDLEYARLRFDSKKLDNASGLTYCESIDVEEKPFIGIASSGMDDFSGVLLERIIDNSAADVAAFTSGDVISYIDDYEIRSACDLRIAVSKLKVGQEIAVTYDDTDAIKVKNMVVGSRTHNYITWTPCSNEIVTDLTLGDELAQEISANKFKIFPNPSNGISTITFEDTTRGELSMEIYDLQGKRIYEAEKINFEGLYEGQINISNQPSGIYLIEMSIGDKKYTKELVVARK